MSTFFICARAGLASTWRAACWCMRSPAISSTGFRWRKCARSWTICFSNDLNEVRNSWAHELARLKPGGPELMFDDLNDLYQQVIIDHSKKPRNFRGMDSAN